MDKILIVDGSAQIIELLRKTLDNPKYEVYSSESGYNALAKIKMFNPDLVIMDVNLPDMSGYDICKRIKENEVTQHIIVLLMSSLETHDVRIRAFRVGADDFIEKTFDSFILLSKVKSLLGVKYLSEQLKQKYAELEEKNNIIAKQFKMAQHIQRSLIPDIDLNFQGIEIVSKYLPALEIGGDFYDVLRVSENCICIVMGDVSGHGISAALLTTMISTMIKNLVNKYFNPDQILFHLNNEFFNVLHKANDDMYACVFLAVIDVTTQKIFYSNAGQTLPVFVSTTENKTFELEAVGIPIGMMRDAKYDYKILNYNKGDMLFFHTDGLSDALYKESPNIFSNRLSEILLLSGNNLTNIINVILNEFYDYNIKDIDKYELDDISMILCRL